MNESVDISAQIPENTTPFVTSKMSEHSDEAEASLRASAEWEEKLAASEDVLEMLMAEADAEWDAGKTVSLPR